MVGFCILVLFTNILNLIKFHPFQNVYFNYPIEKIANDQFEIDYWGLSNTQALRKLTKQDKLLNICNVGLMNLEMSRKMLPKKEKDTISIKGQSFDKCNYIISNKIFLTDPKYTPKYHIPDNFKKIDSITRGNIVVNEIYKKIKMRIFIYKAAIISILAIVVFKLTISSVITNYEKNLRKF